MRGIPRQSRWRECIPWGVAEGRRADSQRSHNHTSSLTHLGELVVRGHKVLDESMPKDPQDASNQIPPIRPSSTSHLSERHNSFIHIAILIMHPSLILDAQLPIC